MDWVGLIISLAGAAACWLIFRGMPVLRSLSKTQGGDRGNKTISVVIPARNEAHTLPLLLRDLAAQTLKPLEIICVDDQSHDGTGDIARAFGATVLTVADKPPGWVGKSYACQLGADAAKGELVLFLDADVRLSPGALGCLVAEYVRTGGAVSVQPYHTPVKWFEQLALFFNLIAAGALATRLNARQKTGGMFGPAILIEAKAYHQAGGHAEIRASVLDDMSLGVSLDRHNLGYQCLLGGKNVRFRMYPEGIVSLFEGFTKNFASGAGMSSPAYLAAVIVWITALSRTPICLVKSLVLYSPQNAILYAACYLLVAALLAWAARKIGRFHWAFVVLYPIPLLFFICTFMWSLFLKLFKIPVRWKGRKIGEERA